jgi:hypothetical protein
MDEYQAHVDIFNHIKNKKPQLAFDAAMKTQRETLAIVKAQILALEENS